MKKILAILALASVSAAFAQSNVSISGVFDAGYSVINSQDATADKNDILASPMSTSNIAFTATEDLGSGLKAGFKGVHLFSPVSGQTVNGATAYQTGNFFNDEMWVGLESATFGKVKLGAPNAGMFETNFAATPYGTGLGSGYSSTGINRLLGQTTTLGVVNFVGGVAANGRVIRNEKSIRYDTPVVAGFSANYTRSPQNDNSATATSNNNGFTDVTANYNNGPFNAAYSVAKAEAGTNVAQGNAAVSALTANSAVKYTFLAANYTVGPATLYYGHTTGKTEGLASDKDVKSNNYGIKYALNGAVDLLGNMVKVTDNAATGAKDQELKAISAVYKLSKRTSTYATYQKYDTDRSSNTAGEVKQYVVGLRHAF